MHDYSLIRLSGELVNMTNEDIFLYEEGSGIIKKIAPSDEELPANPDFVERPCVHYICEPRRLEKIKATGRALSDIAVVCSKCRGRNNTLITRLVWGNDPHIEVRFRKRVSDSF